MSINVYLAWYRSGYGSRSGASHNHTRKDADSGSSSSSSKRYAGDKSLKRKSGPKHWVLFLSPYTDIEDYGRVYQVCPTYHDLLPFAHDSRFHYADSRG